MSIPQPFFRESGEGSAVVCLHCNASSSAQWRALMDSLSGAYRVLTPDSYGSGKSPEWGSDSEIRLQDEVDLLAPVFAKAGDSFALVGHSYGAAVALVAALRNLNRVRALVLYEPTLFSLVDARHRPPNGADGIRNAVVAAASALDNGDKNQAAAHFIDFWMGSGSWASMPPQRRSAIADSVMNVRRWWYALSRETTPLADFAALDVPILYMLGEDSPESAHAVARELIPTLPRVEVALLPGLGHMAPLTHPDQVNAAIARFLGEA